MHIKMRITLSSSCNSGTLFEMKKNRTYSKNIASNCFIMEQNYVCTSTLELFYEAPFYSVVKQREIVRLHFQEPFLHVPKRTFADLCNLKERTFNSASISASGTSQRNLITLFYIQILNSVLMQSRGLQLFEFCQCYIIKCTVKCYVTHQKRYYFTGK